MKSFVRISSLLWADILVAYALFVMQKYLTDVWKLSFTHAVGILNIWNGISMVFPVFFLFLVDAGLGNFRMLVISSISYCVGIGLVTMSTPPVLANSTGTCKKYEPNCIGEAQKVLFYAGMALLALGLAGNLVSLRAFLEKQPDGPENTSSLKNFFRIFGFILVVLLPIVGAIALPYIKPWVLRFGIPAICTTFATFFFLSGWCKYHKVDPTGSPITNVCRVFVACVSKIDQSYPLDASNLHEGNVRKFTHTRCLRCLEKAAIVLDGVSLEEPKKNRWSLCTVAEVEEAKIAVRMVPMWLTFIVCGIVSSFGNTYFVEQANHLNRHIGKWNVPLATLLLLYGWFKKLFDALASCLLENSTKYAPPVGIAIAMVFSILCCITAAKTEERRLNAIRKHDLMEKPDKDIPMTVYWLLFQYFLLAGLDSFFEKSVAEFYAVQAPPSMKNYLNYFTRGVTGLGFMCSVLLVHVTVIVSGKGGKQSWFKYTLNKSRLDRYYWLLAVMSSVNMLVFGVVATCYRYRDRDSMDKGIAGGPDAHPAGAAQDENPSCSCCCYSFEYS